MNMTNQEYIDKLEAERDELLQKLNGIELEIHQRQEIEDEKKKAPENFDEEV